MNIEQRCKQGKMSVAEFIAFARCKPLFRTHCLEEDISYFLYPDIFDDQILRLEKVTELDYLEKGDFITSKNTTGPISGNVFIKIGSNNQHMLIEGDRPYKGKDSIYEAVVNYLKNRIVETKNPKYLNHSNALLAEHY